MTNGAGIIREMQPLPCETLENRLALALQARRPLLEHHLDGVVRLFNGFYEGCPHLSVEWYAGTLLIFAYSRDLQEIQCLLRRVQDFYQQNMPGIACILFKARYAPDQALRHGVAVQGQPAQVAVENGVRYALNLALNQDASFYADTRLLRSWLLENSLGKRVINTFAYTGSLGIAALAGGAQHVVQVDRSEKFLALAKQSLVLNRMDEGRMQLDVGDFYSRAAFYKRTGELFDLAVLDPPFFSTTQKGSVDLAHQSTRLINKLRPLVADGGKLIVVNNALFLSGREYLESLQALCADGYLSIDQIIPIPEDITGYPQTIVDQPPVDPAPFNHPTKIVVLVVRRKG